MLINVLRDEQPTHIAVAFDVSRQSFRTEKYAEYKAGRSRDPGRLPGPGQPDQGGARRAAHPGGREARATRPTTSSPRSPARPATQGMEVLICTGDRDAFQLVDDHVTVLYPRKGVSELARMDPGGGRGEVRRRPRAATATSPRWSARPATTCPACPGVGAEDRRQVDHPVRRRSTAWSRGVDEIKGKAGDSLREHLADVLRNYELNELVCDLRAAAAARRTLQLARLGPRGGAPGLRHPAVPGAARAALPVPGGRRAGGRGGLRPDRRACSARRGGRAGSTTHAPAGTPGRRGGRPAAGAAAPAWLDRRRRWRPAAGAGGLVRPDRRSTDGRRARAGRLAGRPAAAQGDARQQAAAAGVRRARLGRSPASPATPRSPPTWPGPTSARYDLADLALRYLHRELRADAAGDRPAHPRRPRRRRRGRAER